MDLLIILFIPFLTLFTEALVNEEIDQYFSLERHESSSGTEIEIIC